MNKDTFFHKIQSIRCGSALFDLSSPKVMGILNVTPDSFYDGGKFLDGQGILSHTKNMLDEGADIIDIGAYSSRPGAADVPETEELNRLKNALTVIRNHFPDAILSVDTFRANVAKCAIEEFGTNIINDISGGKTEPEIIDIVANYGTPLITMHMQGTPRDMQNAPSYKHVVQDILKYFSEHIFYLKEKGVRDIIIDPGFGFGKTIDHNYQLMSGLDTFQMLETPILVGISRKSMIYNLLNTAPDNALTGTTALNLIALQKGASVLRVHDVKDAKHVITIYEKLLLESEKSINLLKQA